MARIGVSYLRYAKYASSGSTVTYSDGGSLGKATTVEITIDSSDSNILYADNGPAESANTFAGGKVKMGVDDLYDAAQTAILGLEQKDIDSPEKAVELVEGESQQSPYVGVGFIIKHIRNSKTCYTGVILPKTQFYTPDESVDTQEDEIDWQTPEIEADIMRDDTDEKVWRRRATFESEASAQKYIDTFLNITAKGA